MNDYYIDQINKILGIMKITPEEAVRRICRERGIDVEAFLQDCEKKQNELKGR